MGSLGVLATMQSTGALLPPHPSVVMEQLSSAESLGKVADIIEASQASLGASEICVAYQRLTAVWQTSSEAATSTLLSSHPQLQPALLILQNAAIQQLHSIDGQGLGLILWAHAKLGHSPASLGTFLEQSQQEAARRLGDSAQELQPHLQLGPQALSNMVYAYAVLGHHPGAGLLSAIAKGIQSQLRDFLPQVYHGLLG